MNKLQGAKDADVSQTTYLQLFKFFIPLGASTLLITIANMLLNRCLGYIPNSEFYISSFTIARTLLLLFMSPVSVITLAVTAFTENKRSFVKVSKYGLISIIILQIWFLILAFTSLGEYILSGLYNLDGNLLKNAVYSLKTISVLPVLFFVRNYSLGVAIKLRNIKFATLGSFLRTILVLIVSFTMPNLLKIFRPESLPGMILFAMIFIEALVYALGVLITTKGNVTGHIVQSLIRQNTYQKKVNLAYKKILVFALPLILSYSMAQLLPSFTQSALALGENKEVILAIYAVSLSLINIVGAFSFQIPQLVVNHDAFNPDNKNIVRKFCYIIAFIMFTSMLLVAFTQVGDFVMLNILKVSYGNIEISKLTLKFGLFYPASMIFMAYKRGKLIKIRKTTLLVFERVIGTIISLALFAIIPLVSWKYGAGAGILTLTIANVATGFFSDIIFKMSVKRNPKLVSHTL